MTQGEVVTVDYACSDLESGIVLCDGTAADGSTLDTSALGTGIEFTVNAENGAGLTTEVTHTYDVVEAPLSVDVQVSQGTDDAEERRSDGLMDLGSSDLELVEDADDNTDTDQLVGVRFQGVGIPAGATITSAYLEFEVDQTGTSGGPASLVIAGEDADNPGTFTDTGPSDISSRTQTAAEVVWIPEAWDTADAKYQSSDISRVVQEIVDRGGWVSGNAMAFIIEGEGTREAESYDGENPAAPSLHVEYVTDPVPEIASFQQGAGGYTGTVDTYLESNDVAADNSTVGTLIVDLSPVNHVLMRFDDIFGPGPGQVPSGSVIQSAELEINVTNESDTGASLHRMLQPWNDVDNWNTWTNGIQADGVEAEVAAESSSPGSAVKKSSIDVTADLQAWSNGVANHGWAWLQSVDNSWRFDSAEGGTPPVLTVKYFVPVTDPTINVSGTPLSAFSSEPGVPSDVQSYTVSGTDLTDNVVVTAPTDFEVSLSSTTGFGASVTLTQSGGSVASTPVFVRMNAASEGTPSGDITHVSAGATTVNVAVSGTVLPTDTSDPVLVVDVPANGAVVEASSLVFDGSATDDVGVTRVALAVYNRDLSQYWDGSGWQSGYRMVDAVLDNAGGLSTDWTYPFNPASVSSQPYWFQVRGYDAAGKTSNTVERNFTLKSDTSDPVVVVDVPANGAVVEASSLVFDGSATDDVGVTRVALAVYNRDLSQYWDGSGWQSGYRTVDAVLNDAGGLSTDWSYGFIPPSVSSQPYWFQVRAYDAAGKMSNTVTGGFTLQLDTQDPVLVVDVPANGAVLYASSLVFDGSATDDVGVTRVALAVYDRDLDQYWNGSGWQSGYRTVDAVLNDAGALSTDWSYGFVPPSVSSQPYWFQVRAYDAAGKMSNTITGGLHAAIGCAGSGVGG